MAWERGYMYVYDVCALVWCVHEFVCQYVCVQCVYTCSLHAELGLPTITFNLQNQISKYKQTTKKYSLHKL